jgi:hypothetical protein
MPGVQKKIAIGILRHIQSVEERPGFNFRALQIRRDVRNAIVGRDAMTDNFRLAGGGGAPAPARPAQENAPPYLQ